MSILTLYWLIFTVVAFGALFPIMPRQRIRELFSFGFWLGFFWAGVVNWLGMSMFGWRMPGDIILFGIPVFASAYFLPLAIGFANYYPLKKDWMVKVDYVLLFAAITTFLQSSLAIMGMWQATYGWNVAYTFIISALFHVVMSVYYLKVEIKQTA